MIMQVRSKSYTKKVCGKQVMIPEHTVLLSVENHDFFMFSKQNTRTFLQKLEKAGYVRCYVTEKKLGTFVEILESEVYKRYGKGVSEFRLRSTTENDRSSRKKQKEVIGSEFEEMKKRMKKL
jgi:hypothetical protein